MTQNAKPRQAGGPEPGHDENVNFHSQSIENHKVCQGHLSRRKAIRAKCLDCSAGAFKEVNECEFSECDLYPYRMGTGKQNPKERHATIRKYCLWCMDGSKNEVRLCPSRLCPIYAFRNTSANHRKPQKTPYIAIPSTENLQAIPDYGLGVDQ